MEETVELEEEVETVGTDEVPISAVVQSTDWTAETIVSQMTRENIQLNPKFQRRDAWNQGRKSMLIESLIVGLPVPQIVLAQSKESAGKFIVLDGKQRLLTLLQYWGEAPEGKSNGFSLNRLELRPRLNGMRFSELSTKAKYDSDYTALCNHTIRTMVIKNWESEELLHAIFLRLNTGSVSLSPQELRQALHPGPYTNYIDDASVESEPLQELLNIGGPDPRMRDTEILARFIAFRFFAESYPGRMRSFLDESFSTLNEKWPEYKDSVEQAVTEFNIGTRKLMSLFEGRPARKPNSSRFNRAIFDALIYFQSQPSINDAIGGKKARLQKVYDELFDEDKGFASAVESDTADPSNTAARFAAWANAVSRVTRKKVRAPAIPHT